MFNRQVVTAFGSLAICVGVFACTAMADVNLTTPNSTSIAIAQGDIFSIEWLGGDPTVELQLWDGWAEGWNMVGDNVPSMDGNFAWDTSGAYIGWHAIGAWVHPTGLDWYYVASPDWVLVTGVSAEAEVEITNPADTVTVDQGDSYLIEWTGGSPDSIVQLWAGLDDDWMMIAEVAAGDSSYQWDTTGLANGEYVLAAWVKPENTSNWYDIVAPGTVELVPEPMTMSFLVLGSLVLLGKKVRGR